MSIEAMKQWLEALKEAYAPEPHPAIASLEQAIAEAEKQEPAAWGMEHPDGDIIDVITPEEHAREEGGYTVALYREPQPKREPLTDEQITEGWRALPIRAPMSWSAYEAGVRMAEASHGIKEKNAQ